MSNTSASGGYLDIAGGLGLRPVEDALHDFFAGITGLAPQLVRPRWQVEGPQIPAPDTNWLAFGLTQIIPYNLPESRHIDLDQGHELIIGYHKIRVVCSMFGPDSYALALALYSGLHLEQNLAQLRPVGLALARVDSLTMLPELLDAGWRQRVDLHLEFHLRTSHAAQIFTITSGSGASSLETDSQSGSGQDLLVPITCQNQDN